MAKNQLDLGNLFSQVASTLIENKTSLNKADTHNNDHGDNMAEIFKMVSQAMDDKKGASAADQLDYAADLLRNKNSGSAQIYAKGFEQAAKDFAGENITSGNAMQMIQTLMGGGESVTKGEDNPIGSLIGGLFGGKESASDDKFDIGDLLGAGMAFMSAKQEGDSNVEALMDALVSGSAMGDVPHRAQSSQLVLNTLMNVVGSLGKK
jgi:hypothetical protein